MHKWEFVREHNERVAYNEWKAECWGWYWLPCTFLNSCCNYWFSSLSSCAGYIYMCVCVLKWFLLFACHFWLNQKDTLILYPFLAWMNYVLWNPSCTDLHCKFHLKADSIVSHICYLILDAWYYRHLKYKEMENMVILMKHNQLSWGILNQRRRYTSKLNCCVRIQNFGSSRSLI